MTTTKSVRICRKGQFVIPKEAREALGVREGDELLVSVEGSRLILTRPQEYARTTRGLLRGTWARSPRAVARYVERERRSWP